MRPPPPRTPAVLLLALGLSGALPSAGCGLSGGRVTAVEENDGFNLGGAYQTDRDYTQGAFLAFTTADENTPAPARAVARALPLFAEGAPVHLGFLVGQEIYTPANLSKRFPIPDDRPYAAALFAGLALQSPLLDRDPLRRRDRLDHLEIDLGVLGPAALGEPVQNDTHRAFAVPQARGWEWQVANEPAVEGIAERRWRLLAGESGTGAGWDLIPLVRLRAGTLRVDAAAGVLARVGWNLPRGFGPMAVDATGLVRGAVPPPPWFAFHGGLEGRAVARDGYLGRNTFDGVRTATPAPLAHTSTAGLSLGWGPFTAVFEQHWVSPEFRQRRRHHRYSTLVASWAVYF